MLRDEVDLVTASPYHPQGSVRNVPRWRLSLSKSASALYRVLSRQKIGTYTSCFRVYRRETALDLHIVEPGFLGIAEIISKIDLRGGNIAEYPTMLEARILGYSKMRTFRTILGHVQLLSRLAWLRLCGRLPPRVRTLLSPQVAEDVSGMASSTKRR
jgi:dolichol-phosphate mannosyltransferase